MLGHAVDVVCLRRGGEAWRERDGRVTIYRVPLAHRRGGARRYLFEYGAFLFLASILLTLMHLRRRYRLVQVNSMPDALAFAALVPKLLGAKVLLDLHECMPEFFATKFSLSPDHPLVRLVAFAEQASIRLADVACTCTEQMREAFIGRGAQPEKIKVVLNAADERLFDRERYPPQTGDPQSLHLVCHGSVEPLYGLDTVVRAVARLRTEIPQLTVSVYGEGTHLPELRALSQELGVEEAVHFSGGFVPMDELLHAISTADAGVVAIRRDRFRDLVHCNKMYEFIAMGKPVICSRTRSVQSYFSDDCFQYFISGDEDDLARAIRELYHDRDLAQQMSRRAEEVNEPYRWDHQRRVYQAIAAGLIAR